MGNTIVTQPDINKRPMSTYYGELSTLYFKESRSDVNLEQVKALVMPPTRRFIVDLVK